MTKAPHHKEGEEDQEEEEDDINKTGIKMAKDVTYVASIKRQVTCRYTPQQNGVAERKNRYIAEIARAMLNEMNVARSSHGFQRSNPRDFPLFLGSFNEDPNAHVQLFEVICGAHEMVDDSRKSRIFPATLRGDASEWYANLGVHKRTTYDDLKANFLRKFRGLGFEEKLAEELDHLRQGATESIEKYIDRMDTIVRKLGDSAPDRETLKRRFLVGLHDGKVEEYIRLKRLVRLEEVKHEARIWEEVQCVLWLHRDRLSSHSRSLEEKQESTMVVDINEKREVELLDKLKADMFAKVEPTCSPMIRGHVKVEHVAKVVEPTRKGVSMSPIMSPNVRKVEVFYECRPKVQSKLRRKFVVNQSVPEVGVIPRVQASLCEERTCGDRKPAKRQERILATGRDGHKNDAIITSNVVATVECEALEDVGLQRKVQ
ncbi:hypothetical protein KP509_10G079700 [Ceratopteris richardii]|uniref:Retrotransposon gag domain-containing protein n=1 Tax=Ceratopteris richardii TaxID=49495 RepID=A0A8T2TZ00_CERRI|nr:hypothetical protein KP509_10G079700 [Ceratopteris richardii]